MAVRSTQLSARSALVLTMIAEGNTYEQILRQYPELTYPDIFAAAQEALDAMTTSSASEQPSEEKLRAEFHQAMLDLYDVAARRGYRATRFRTMVEEWGGVETAKRLLSKPGVQDGLTRLWELDLLGYSTEALVLQDRFRCLFTEQELQEARTRLEQFGFFSKQ